MRGAMVGAAAALVALAGCDGPTAGGGGVTPEALRVLAPEWEAAGMAGISAMGAASYDVAEEGAGGAGTITTTFSLTHPCPSGGTASVEGTHVASGDAAARTGTMRVDATRTDAACAFPVRRGGTLTITTTPSVALAAEQSFTSGVPGVRTATQKGSFDWRHSSGVSGSCAVDLTSTWTPATRTHTLRGTFCGQAIDLARTPGG